MKTQKYKVEFDFNKRHVLIMDIVSKGWDFLYMGGELFVYCPIGQEKYFERVLVYYGAQAFIYTNPANC